MMEGRGKGKAKTMSMDIAEIHKEEEKEKEKEKENEDLQCVGRLEIQKHKQNQVGFICGSLPVPVPHSDSDCGFFACGDALVSPFGPPHTQRVRAPRYRMIPTETDLNELPSVGVGIFPEDVVFPPVPHKTISSADRHGFCGTWSSGHVNQPIQRKCEALAVSGIAAYGDEIDVVAPLDILKQIFKIPYSKARLSVAVHRIGGTLVLNTGPDVEEGENLVRRKKNQSKGIDQSLFLNFAMHSVRAEACDCPPSAKSTVDDSANSTFSSEQSVMGFSEEDCLSSSLNQQSPSWHFVNDDKSDDAAEEFHPCAKGSSQTNRDGVSWSSKHGRRQNSRLDALKKASHLGENQHCSTYVQKDTEKHCRLSNEGFLRVLFWQFHNFRMLLGSDLLVYSNEKHVAVSLHLWEVERQVTPLMWLDAWLDNVMASVPELAICYHHKGVVQGYELLKTDDIFLLKGIAEDGTAVFHPQVVQQNGLSVLKFLQDNCKQDPGSYWLYKNAGEDLMQLFDLSVLSKSSSSDKDGKTCSPLPSSKDRVKMDYTLPLGILLYRVAHRLSLSKVPNDRPRCAKLFKKCLDFLNEHEHLVVRACAHEQVARLILKCYEELGSTMEIFLLESESSITDVQKMSSLELSSASSSIEMLALNSSDTIIENVQDTSLEVSVPYISSEARNFPMAERRDIETLEGNVTLTPCSENEDKVVCQIEEASPRLVKSVTDPVSAKLAAVHHVSQAIKSLRWQRQLQDTGVKVTEHDNKPPVERSSFSSQLPVCICGDIDCLEVCDIREWLAGSRMDRKLCKLVLLLGESYLALGQAYKDDGQLHRALKVVELACSVYGSIPPCLEIQQISTGNQSTSDLGKKDHIKAREGNDPLCDDGQKVYKSHESSKAYNPYCRKGIFWGQAWILVGDIYVEYQRLQRDKLPCGSEDNDSRDDLKMASEVMKEVKRLKKKLTQPKRNCIVCSLTNCSCQSDRASSGNSASSSSSDGRTVTFNRKQTKKTNSKRTLSSHLDSSESDSDPCNSGCVHGHGSERGDSEKRIMTAQIIKNALSGSKKVQERAKGPIESEDLKKVHKEDGQFAAVSKRLNSNVTNISNGKTRDIFSFLEGPKDGDLEANLSEAADCYEAANDALQGILAGAEELQSATRKKGWVCNELGRWRLENKELKGAETSFATAIKAFRQVKDFTNIVLINCNLAHGRRALAESLASRIDTYKQCGILQNAYKQMLDDVKFQYGEALKYYGAARFELNAVEREADSIMNSLWNEVYTQYAHTYLRLGMLLAREDASASILGNVNWEEMPTGCAVSSNEKTRKSHQRKHEITANDAIREALVLYESLGSLRAQEAAFAHFQLACYQRDCCLKALNFEGKELLSEKRENVNFQQARRYASLAERYWQKAMEFYHAETHCDMFLQILMERSALCLALSTYSHSNMMLESALCFLLEGRYVFGAGTKDPLGTRLDALVVNCKVLERFSQQLQSLLKTMLAAANNINKHSNRVGCFQSRTRNCCENSTSGDVQITGNRVADVGKLRELYRIALKSDGLPDLCSMYDIWAS